MVANKNNDKRYTGIAEVFSVFFAWYDKFKNLSRQGRQNTAFEFEWTRRNAATDDYSREFCKQAIKKLSLACSFRIVGFIGQNLVHVWEFFW